MAKNSHESPNRPSRSRTLADASSLPSRCERALLQRYSIGSGTSFARTGVSEGTPLVHGVGLGFTRVKNVCTMGADDAIHRQSNKAALRGRRLSQMPREQKGNTTMSQVASAEDVLTLEEVAEYLSALAHKFGDVFLTADVGVHALACPLAYARWQRPDGADGRAT